MQAQTQSSAARHSAASFFPNTPTPTLAAHAGLAHDAGNLLNALGLYCDLLLQPGVLRPEHLHYATELSLIAGRSRDLIRRLLTGDERTPANIKEPSAAASLRALAPILQHIAGSTIRVAVDVSASLPPLPFPAEALERITVNLVLNAAQALQNSGRTEGRITVTLSAFAGHLKLMVEDNGPGLPSVMAAAFLRPTPLPPGAVRGVGHRVVHELAAATGGQLSVRVRPGAGTVFCLKWLLADAPSHLAATEAQAA